MFQWAKQAFIGTVVLVSRFSGLWLSDFQASIFPGFDLLLHLLPWVVCCWWRLVHHLKISKSSDYRQQGDGLMLMTWFFIGSCSLSNCFEFKLLLYLDFEFKLLPYLDVWPNFVQGCTLVNKQKSKIA